MAKSQPVTGQKIQSASDLKCQFQQAFQQGAPLHIRTGYIHASKCQHRNFPIGHDVYIQLYITVIDCVVLFQVRKAALVQYQVLRCHKPLVTLPHLTWTGRLNYLYIRL